VEALVHRQILGRPSRALPQVSQMAWDIGCAALTSARRSRHPAWAMGAMKFGLQAGDAMDLTTGWDFTKEEDRAKAEKCLDDQKPLVLIGSPPCVAFSQLQSLIPDSQREAKQLAEGIKHMEFMAQLYKKLMEGGRIFLHENLAHAKPWALPCIKKLMREMGVLVVEADQCIYGLKTWGRNKPQPMLAKKPTRFITTSHVLGRVGGKV